MQLTLVAFYARKSPAFARFLRACQSEVSAVLGDRFRCYDTAQIHATIFGLERCSGHAVPFANRNLEEQRGQIASMDFAGLIEYLRNQWQPLRIQLGGFENRDYPFTSRSLRPFDRSFSIQGDKVVLMGWPVSVDGRAAVFPETLDKLRRTAARFNIRHAYHRGPGDIDNDLFMRIGMIDEPAAVPDAQKERLCQRVRQLVSSANPLLLDLAPEDLAFVAYDNEELQKSATRVLSITDASVTADTIEALYDG